MADPICRWRNPYVKTIRLFIDFLPRSVMPVAEARDLINRNFDHELGDSFFRTPYQLASQLGLYYEDENNYYPRFTFNPTLEQIYAYLRNWITKYYAPNPYTPRGFDNIDPLIIHSRFCELLTQSNGADVDWNQAKLDVFKEQIGNDDILKNSINAYSDVIAIQGNSLKIKDGAVLSDLNEYIKVFVDVDRNDRLAFFNQFSFANTIEKKKLTAEYPHNLIMYGAPGTGKSNELNVRSSVFNDRFTRITFYPDYSYSKFVGSYKPSTYYKSPASSEKFYNTRGLQIENKSILNEPVIDYTFQPGPFLNSLVQAFLTNEPYLLIIEELNRANAAAVFGEVFQMLDRKDGISTYKVILSDEAMAYLKDALGDKAKELLGGVFLPENLYIWATMNSADQGVFNMDSAFKRRWSFEYLPLNKNESICDGLLITFCGKKYEWNHFRKVINEHLIANKISEDRLLGPFFLSKSELSDINSIKNKLLLYLRDDVLRHNFRRLFTVETFGEIIGLFDSHSEEIFVPEVMEKLLPVLDV